MTLTEDQRARLYLLTEKTNEVLLDEHIIFALMDEFKFRGDSTHQRLVKLTESIHDLVSTLNKYIQSEIHPE